MDNGELIAKTPVSAYKVLKLRYRVFVVQFTQRIDRGRDGFSTLTEKLIFLGEVGGVAQTRKLRVAILCHLILPHD